MQEREKIENLNNKLIDENLLLLGRVKELEENNKTLEYKANYIDNENKKFREYIRKESDKNNEYRSNYIKLQEDNKNLLQELEQKDLYINSLCNQIDELQNEYTELEELNEGNYKINQIIVKDLELENDKLLEKVQELEEKIKYLYISNLNLKEDLLKSYNNSHKLLKQIDYLNDYINDMEKYN